MKIRLLMLTALCMTTFVPRASADTTGTLTLDALSFISFGDQQVLPIPPGSTLAFHFGTPAPDGSIPFTFDPADLSMAPIPITGDATLQYSLGSAVSGVIVPTESGRRIEFKAVVNAKVKEPAGGGGSYSYAIPFTTESAAATDLAGTMTLEITGMRLIEGVWHVQLVGATVNKENAFPRPGTAVYTVLSGQFDQMP